MEEADKQPGEENELMAAHNALMMAHINLMNALFRNMDDPKRVAAFLHQTHASLMYNEIMELTNVNMAIAKAMERRANDGGEREEAKHNQGDRGNGVGGPAGPAGRRPGVRQELRGGVSRHE